MKNPNIIGKYLIRKELSVTDFRGNVKETLERALTQCDKVELFFNMSTNYDKKYDLVFPPNELGLITADFVIKEGVTYFNDLPYFFTFQSVQIDKRTLSAFRYKGLDDILQEDLFISLQEQYLKYKEEYKFNVIKSLFMDGRFFKYKNFPLQYSFADGDIFEHPINENDIVTSNFAKVTKYDENGFFYKTLNYEQESYISFDELDFTFKHKIQ